MNKYNLIKNMSISFIVSGLTLYSPIKVLSDSNDNLNKIVPQVESKCDLISNSNKNAAFEEINEEINKENVDLNKESNEQIEENLRLNKNNDEIIDYNQPKENETEETGKENEEPKELNDIELQNNDEVNEDELSILNPPEPNLTAIHSGGGTEQQWTNENGDITISYTKDLIGEDFFGNDKFAFALTIKSTTNDSDVKVTEEDISSFARKVGCDRSDDIKSVIIGDGVTGIGKWTFIGCFGLISVEIGDSVKSIEEGAFDNCPGLTSVKIGNSVTIIGDYAFMFCSSLKSVIIPDSVKIIGDHAFERCRSLGSVIIPDSVKSIGESAFEECISLGSVIIPDSVESIGNRAFAGCVNLRSLTISNIVESIGNYAFARCTSLESVIIPDIVKSIGDHAFEMCSSLESVIIPDNVKSIGESAFEECTSLQLVIIPDSVESIGNRAFARCSILRSLTVSNIVESIGNYAFAECINLESVIIPDSVTSIGEGAFNECTGLTTIEIPNGVTNIGLNAFNGCSALNEVRFENPSVIENIGEGAFSGCTSLGSITIPDKITSIEKEVFNGCTGLKSITIPDSVTSIGANAFNGCTSLKSITIPDSVTSIGEGTFRGCTNLGSITIPDQVTSIKKEVFKDCTSLTEIEIPAGITCIEEGLFNGCTGLKSITIPDSVTSIGANAFNKCEGLELKKLPSELKTIGKEAFKNCTGLTEIEEIPAGITGIEEGLFNGCTGLKSITIPDGVTSIGANAFNKCEVLKLTSLPGNIEEIREGAFNNCKELKLKNLPSRLKNIGKEAFKDCIGLTEIEIPAGITGIEEGLFNGCTGLKSITMPESVTSIGANAFKECTSLESITIPNEVESIGNAVFEESGVKEIKFEGKYIEEVVSDAFNKLGTTGDPTVIYYPLGKGWEETTGVVDNQNYAGATNLKWIGYKYCGDSKINNGKNVICKVEKEGDTYKAKIFKSDSNDLDNILKTDITGETDFKIGDGELPIFDGLKTSVASVAIEEGITSIGSNAFNGCTSLKSITIPDSVTSIGEGTFKGCTNLGSITIPDQVTSIKKGAFKECTSLTEIEIPAGITCIEEELFNGCTGLKSITIPDGVTSIGANAFNNCKELELKKLPSKLKTIGKAVFKDCTGLTEIEIPAGITGIEEGLFNGCTGLKSIKMPESVTSIGMNAFNKCTGLTTIEIPNKVTSIGANAFKECTSLESITIPNKVESIGNVAFGESGVKEIKFEGKYIEGVVSDAFNKLGTTGDPTVIYYPLGKGWEETTGVVDNQNYAGATNLKWIGYKYCGNSEINEGKNVICKVEKEGDTYKAKIFKSDSNDLDNILKTDITRETDFKIGDGELPIFDGLKTSVASVAIEEGITSIGSNAFNGCTGLKSITMPESVTSIGMNAFNKCTGLTTIEIPNKVTSIGANAFKECTSLGSITIPANVTSIGNAVFEESGVKEIKFEGGALGSAGNPLAGVNGATIYYPLSELNSWGNVTKGTSYAGATNLKWVGYKYCGEGENEKKLLCLVMKNNTGTDTYDVEIKRSEGITEGNFNMEDSGATIPEEIKSKVTSVKIGNGVSNIGKNTFKGCTSLTEMEIPEGVTEIGEGAFNGCTGLKSITIPDSVKSIGANAFSGCKGLAVIEIPSGVKSIGANAFDETGIKEIKFEGTVPDIDDNLLLGLGTEENPTIIYYPLKESGWNELEKDEKYAGAKNIKWIGYKYFEYCGRKDQNFGKNLKCYIGENETEVEISKTSIANEDGFDIADYSDDNLLIPTDFRDEIISIIVGKEVTGIGKNAFKGCTKLNKIKFEGGYISNIADDAFSGLGTEEVPTKIYYPRGKGWEEAVINEDKKVVKQTDYAGAKNLEWIGYNIESNNSGSGVNSLYLYYENCGDEEENRGEDVICLIKDNQGKYELELKKSPTASDGSSFKVKDGNLVSDYYRDKVDLIMIEEGISNIGDESFEECTGVKKIEIPASINRIGQRALADSGIEEISFKGKFPKLGIGEGAFEGLSAKIYYPIDKWTSSDIEKSEKYGGKIEWIGYKYCGYDKQNDGKNILLEMRSIGNGKYEIKILKSVEADDSGFDMKDFVDEGLIPDEYKNKIESIVIDKDVSRIGKKSFANCLNVKSIRFEGDFPKNGIGKRAFLNLESNIYYLSSSDWNKIRENGKKIVGNKNYKGAKELIWKNELDSEDNENEKNEIEKCDVKQKSKTDDALLSNCKEKCDSTYRICNAMNQSLNTGDNCLKPISMLGLILSFFAGIVRLNKPRKNIKKDEKR